MTVRDMRLALAALPNDVQDTELVILTPERGEWIISRVQLGVDAEGMTVAAIIPDEG